MKVLFNLHYPPPIHGAAMVGDYIRKSSIINSEIDGRYINLSTSLTIDEIGQSGVKKYLRYLGIIFQVLKQLMVFRPDWVYITLTSTKVGFFKDSVIVFLCKALGFRMIFHFHNKGGAEEGKSKLDNLIYQKVFHNSRVILLSPLLYSDIEAYVHEDNVFYCVNGIPEVEPKIKIQVLRNQSQEIGQEMEISIQKKYDPRALGKKALINIEESIGLEYELENSNKPDSEDGIIRILFLSNLIKSKGVFVLLEACKILKEKGLNFNLIMAGGEGDISSDELKSNIQELGLESVVFYRGNVFGQEKFELFDLADMFVHPTFNDCFPLVLLEAMQSGLPIISTREGAIPEIVEEGITGLLVSKQNPVELAQDMAKLILDGPLRKSMGKNAQIKFEKKYTLEKFEYRFIEVMKLINASK